MEKLTEPQGNQKEEGDVEAWLYTGSGRTPLFQAFLDSLETQSVRRVPQRGMKPGRPVGGNYATFRG